MFVSDESKLNEAEKLYQAGVRELSYEKLHVAMILFRRASAMGHTEAARFLAVLSKCI